MVRRRPRAFTTVIVATIVLILRMTASSCATATSFAVVRSARAKGHLASAAIRSMVSETRVARQEALHRTPQTGELYLRPMGPSFNTNNVSSQSNFPSLFCSRLSPHPADFPTHPPPLQMKLFCNQCSQHAPSCGTSQGACKKTPESARLQDEVVQVVTEIAHYAHALRKAGKEVPKEVNDFLLLSMFSTL